MNNPLQRRGLLIIKMIVFFLFCPSPLRRVGMRLTAQFWARGAVSKQRALRGPGAKYRASPGMLC
jgi:hypothetical protein